MVEIRQLGTAIDKIAGAALNGHRAIAVVGGFAIHADQSIPTHWHNVAGLSIGAFIEGALAVIQVEGPITEASWNWIPDLPIFVATDGLLTQTAPTSGAVIQIGTADTDKQISLHVRSPIVKA